MASPSVEKNYRWGGLTTGGVPEATGVTVAICYVNARTPLAELARGLFILYSSYYSVPHPS